MADCSVISRRSSKSCINFKHSKTLDHSSLNQEPEEIEVHLKSKYQSLFDLGPL